LVGIVAWTAEKAASLEPLYQLAQDGTSSYRRVEDLRGEYPDRGRVVWFNPPRDAQEGSVWRLDVTDCMTYHKAEQNADALMVVPGSYQELSEILDLRHVGDDEEIRREVTGDGVQLRQPTSHDVFLWVGHRRFVGPVRLERVGAGQRWRLNASQVEDPLASWQGDEDDALVVGEGGARRIVATGRTWRKSGLIDWNPDDVKVLLRTLHDLRKLDPAFAQTIPLTSKSIERLGSVLASATMADRSMHEQRLRRAERFLPRLGETGRLSGELMGALLTLPAVLKEFDRHQVTVEEAVRKETTDRMATELAHERGELDRLVDARTAALQELDSVRAQIRAESQRLDAVVGSFEQSLSGRIAAVVKTPQHFLAEVVMLRAALGLPARAPDEGRNKGTTPFGAGAPDVVVTHLEQLKAALEISFQRAELPPGLSNVLLAAFLAKGVPALVGGRATDVLRTYARCAMGGRVVRVALSPGILSPRDLLEQYAESNNGVWRLRDILQRIAEGDGLALVILENVNVCPLDTSLLPLLRTQGAEGGLLPSNAVLAATLSVGPARLPLSAAAWEYLALVPVSGVGSIGTYSSHPDRRDSPLPLSSIAPSSWLDLRASTSEVSVVLCADALGRLPESLELDLGVRDQALRVFSAFVACGYEQRVALEETLAVAVSPSVVGRADAFAAALAEQGHLFQRVRAVLRTAAFLNA
jgi:hypothetical protein